MSVQNSSVEALPPSATVQAGLFYCTFLYDALQILHFLQTEGKTLRQQKVDLLWCDTSFIVVVWNHTCNISEVCVYLVQIFWFP